MENEWRAAARDGGLDVEAYCFRGIVQPFPKHFHEYYVLGLVEDGVRELACMGREYIAEKGDLLLFNPGDSHACVQSGGALDYRSLGISRAAMLDLAEGATGRRELPVFSPAVVRDADAGYCLRQVHEMVMEGSQEPGKEEGLLLLIAMLARRYGRTCGAIARECRREIALACGFMEQHYAERMSLERICRYAGLSKSALLRAFAVEKDVTPYSYLRNIRIGRAKELLEQGASPMDAALRTGFSDQSHFTNCFSRVIGITPGAYREFFSKGRDEQHGRGQRKMCDDN